jgi:hypothetical protein
MQAKFLMITTAAALILSVCAQATPLRELIFQTMDQEQQGVLTSSEITQARKLGAARYRVHGDYDANIDSVAKKSARQIFPTDARKQQEWELEYTIGWMMAAEAALWTP